MASGPNDWNSGIVEELFEAGHVALVLADADAEVEAEGLPEHGDRPDPRAQPAQQRLRLLGVGIQQDGELVAAAAPGAPAVAHDLGDPLAERAQRLVAGGVTVAVVDLLEQVDVGHDRGEGPAGGARARVGLLAEPAHLLVVVLAGQAVALGLPAVAPALAEGAAQEAGQQQHRRQQRHHAQQQEQLAPLGGGDLQRGELLLRLQQRDLLLLQPGVEFHLQIGQPALARVAFGRGGGRHGLLQVRERLRGVAAALGKPGQNALGLGDREVRALPAVVLQRPGQHRFRLVQPGPGLDQALGHQQARAPRAGREARRLELRQRLARPVQPRGVAPLGRGRLADAVLAVGDEDQVAGAAAGLDLPPPPRLGLAVVPGLLLGQGDVAQGQALRPQVA